MALEDSNIAVHVTCIHSDASHFQPRGSCCAQTDVAFRALCPFWLVQSAMKCRLYSVL